MKPPQVKSPRFAIGPPERLLSLSPRTDNRRIGGLLLPVRKAVAVTADSDPSASGTSHRTDSRVVQLLAAPLRMGSARRSANAASDPEQVWIPTATGRRGVEDVR